MAVKPGVFPRVPSLVERKFPQNHDAPSVVNAANTLVYSRWIPATETRVDFGFGTSRVAAVRVSAGGTIDTPVFGFTVKEIQIKVISPGTASSTAQIKINGTNIDGAASIPLDVAAGTILITIPTGNSSADGASGDAVTFAKTGDTNSTFEGEVSIVYEPTVTQTFSVFI